MATKKGKDLMLSIGGTIYGYATECSIDLSTDTSEITSTKYKHKNSAGKFKEYETDVNSISLSASYVLSDSEEDYLALVQAQLQGLPLDVSFIDVQVSDATDGGITGNIEGSSNGLKAAGKALITSISLSAPVSDECTFSVSLQGTGAWTFTKQS